MALKATAQQTGTTYTQYMDNLTPLNPTYSLLDKGGSINALARKQYTGIQGAPTLFIFNGSVPIESVDGAAGLIIGSNQFAVESNTDINAFFAKSIALSGEDHLAVSLSAGVKRYVANYSSVDPNDPAFKNDIRETKPNLGFGVMYYGDKYYVGISVPQLTIASLGTASVQDNSNFKNHYYLSAAYLGDLGEDIKVKTAGLLSYTQGIPAIGDVSAVFYLKELLGVGVNFRTNNAVAGIISINTNQFRIGYSYQFSTSSSTLNGISNATQEVSISYRFGDTSTSKLL